MSVVANAALADPYQLGAGDQVALRYTAQGITEELTIDIDGQLRVSGVGGINVEGLSLDDAERRIGERIASAGTYLNPAVSLQIVKYAPIILSGDVAEPGQYSYVPGMTAGAAVALSGGSKIVGVSRFEFDRARVENEGQLQILNLDIAGDILRIARLEALLSQADEYGVDVAQLARVPSVASLPIAKLREAEHAQFENARDFLAEGIAAWESEITTLERQLELLGQRVTVQQALLETAAEELETSQDLRARGLQTAQRYATAEQRDADARLRVLELDSARMSTAQALAEAKRSRQAFERNRREEWLAGLQSARLSLESNELAYARRLKQQVLLSGTVAGSAMLAEMITPNVTIISRRKGRETLEQVALDTTVLPGDLIVLTISSGAPQGR